MSKFNFKGKKPRINIPRLRPSDLIERRKKAIVVGAVIVGLVLLAAVGYGFWFTSQSEFCASCHEMQPAVDSWKESSLHAEVSCNTCHAPGLLRLLQQKGSLVVETYKHYSKSFEEPLNVESKLSKNIDGDGCLQCHTPKRIITPRKSLTMNHNVHLEKGINCTTCHNRAGHPTSEGYKDFISMEGCFRCHGLSKTALAPGRCNACHPPSFDIIPATGPLNHRTATWRKPDHGKKAVKNMDSCLMCHQKTFCKGCHGIDVPHPDKFVKQDHGGIGKKSPEICQKCHGQGDFCNACHHEGYKENAGGWVPTHKYVVARVGPAYCFKCHGPTYCAWCHVRGQLPPSVIP